MCEACSLLSDELFERKKRTRLTNNKLSTTLHLSYNLSRVEDVDKIDRVFIRGSIILLIL